MPSDHPEFVEFLVACGINSMSVSPNGFFAVKSGSQEPRRDSSGQRRTEHEISCGCTAFGFSLNPHPPEHDAAIPHSAG